MNDNVDINHFKTLYKYITENLNLEKKEFTLEFISIPKIKKLNKKYRGIDTKTDVISLEYHNPVFLGEIYISPDVVLENSKIYKCEFGEEMDRTFIHGILHLVGYNHKGSLNKKDLDPNEEMFIIQEKILAEFRKSK